LSQREKSLGRPGKKSYCTMFIIGLSKPARKEQY